MNKLANEIRLAPTEGFRGRGELGLEGIQAFKSAEVLTRLISRIIGVLTVVAFLWFTFKLLTGAIQIISAGSDKAKYEEARGNLTYGLIGVVITVAGIFIIDLVASFLNIEFLDIEQIIVDLSP